MPVTPLRRVRTNTTPLPSFFLNAELLARTIHKITANAGLTIVI